MASSSETPETPPAPQTSIEAAQTEAGAEAVAEIHETAPAIDWEAACIAAQADAEKYKDQLLRAMADAENLRRRTERELDERGKFAVTNFAREILPVADNLRRALESLPAEALEANEVLKTFATGVELTERTLLAALEKFAVKPIEAQGARFDPNLHQAMFEVEDPSQPAGTVVQVLQGGYTIAERLLRPALVGVSKGGPKAEPAVDTTV